MELSRRNCLALAGSSLLAGAAASAAEADGNNPDVLYGHGMVWNRQLPGELGELRLSFDLKINPQTGDGLGSASDPTNSDWSIHYDINSVVQEKRPKGETRYTMTGVVTEAIDPSRVGQEVKIIAETAGDTTAIAIRVGENAFGGAGLVVVSVLDVLIRAIRETILHL